jgi:arginine decarboxylase
MINGDDFMPKECFFTKGVGRHKEKLMSFELALRDAGIEKQNLVRVSSIYPTSCKIISKNDGLPKLKPGQITFCVLAEAATDEPNRLICAGIGLAIPKNHVHGYIAEHHGYGMTEKRTEDLCEDLAATMLATTLGIPFDAEKAWDEREQQFMMSGEIVKTRGWVQTAEGDKVGLWTSVISAVVMILSHHAPATSTAL